MARAILVAFLLGAGVAVAAGSRGGTFAGVIQDLSCEQPALKRVRTDGQKAVWQTLDRKTDLYRPLAEGDQLRCQGKGAIVVTGWVKPVTDGPGIELHASGSKALLYNPEGFAAAAARGEDDVIRFPARDSRILARDFAILWRPPGATNQINLSLLSPVTGRTLCSRDVLNGARPRIDSPELVAALIQARSAQPPDKHFVLKLVGPAFDEMTVPFSVLSSAEETQIENELNEWNSAEALLRYLGRAHVYRNWKLSMHEAEEAESALKESPGSPYLRGLCLQAEDRANNAARVRELATIR